jgi:hypothetical protein
VTDNTLIGWQPIESAPKERDDYSWSPTFVAWGENYGDPFPCKQRKGVFYDLEVVDRDGDWAVVDLEPTHWMPLPAPPQ